MDRVVLRVRRLAAAVEAYWLAVARALGTGITETNALVDLTFHGPMTPSTLADRLGLASPSVTALVDRLETAGLVVRRRHPADRRSVFVELSVDGETAVRSMSDMFSDDILRAVADESPEHLDVLERLLNKITVDLRLRASDQESVTAALAAGLERHGSARS
ncbi:MAG TPA: MarR family transcriptional regulator [Pseudonocardia sp.]|jgi:DNA-binding MarR family transcriptional regulator